MPLGTDSPGMLARLKSLVPNGWVQDFTLYDALGLPIAPIANAVLGGVADALAWVYAQAQVIRRQTRRFGTTGWLLDVDAYGFFGSAFLRKPNEADAAWRKRYTDEVFRPRVTRAAIDKALFDLTGRHPLIYEPWNGGDAGGYGTGGLGYGGGNPNAGLSGGYGAPIGGYGQGSDAYFVSSGKAGSSKGGGFYGSLNYPYQIFITAFRPASAGIPLVAGYGYGAGAYGEGTTEYADISAVEAAVSDAEIYACVARTVGAGITAWVAIQN